MNKETQKHNEEEMNRPSDQGAENASTNTELNQENEAVVMEEEDFALKYSESQNKLLRLLADFENMKKRMAKERMEYVKTAGQDIFLAILPVLDDLDRAEKMIDQAEDVSGVKEGVDLIIKKLRLALEQKGLKEMEVIGTVFDSDLHDAIAQVPAPSEEMKGKIIDCAEKGYELNGSPLRVPKVVVGQ